MGSKCQGQMGKTSSLKRVCNRVPLSSIPSRRSHMDNTSKRTTSIALGRNKSNVRERGYNRDKNKVKRVLLNLLPCAQTRRESKTNSKPKTIEQVSKGSEIQNVYSSNNNPDITSRGLVGIDRFERRILSNTDSRESQTIPKICISGTDLSVQCPAFRNINGSKSLYQGLGTYSRDSSRERCSNVPLSRRLFTGSQISQSVTMGSPTDSGRPRSGRFSDKHKEISPMPSPEASISRCRVGYPSSHILFTKRSCLGAEANSSGLHETRFQKNCETVSSPVRFNGRSNSYDSLGQIENETYSNVSKQSLEGCISTPRVLFTDSPMVDNTYSLVGRLYESDPGFIMEEDSSHKSVNYRRKSGRLGRSFTFKKSSRSLEGLPTTPTHQCSRITGSVQFPEIVPAQSQGSNSPSPNRQYDSSPLHKQIRRYQIFKNVQFNNESDRMVHKEQNRSDSDTHPRYSQHTGRYAVEEDISLSRVGVSRQSSKTSLSDLEYSSDRSFCNFRKQKTSKVLLPSPVSPGRSCKRSKPGLVQDVCLRLPTHSVDTSGSDEGGEGASINDFNSSQVVQKGLVSHSPEPTCRLSSQASGCNRSSNATKTSAASSQSSRIATGGLDDQQNRLLAEGLSQEAAETLLASRSENTNKSYQSGWKHFTRWCENRNDDPFTATVTEIVNYLQSCLNDGLSYNTVSLRVNAIQAHHHKYRDGISLRCTPKMQRFLKGSFVKYPPVKDRVPSWDLPTVLEAMKRAPFEPLQTIPLNLLTFKTIFLLGICSAKRIGELQSLDCRPPFCSVGEGGIVLRPNAQFIPKVPALTNIEQTLEFSPFGRDSRNPEGTDRAICVCRAVKIYLQRTKNLRQTHQLFVTYKHGDQGRPVKTQTIATWLKKAISMGHDLQDKPLEGSVKAHSVRKQSCSWADVKCASILDICKQACWQSSNTFVQHYKLDVARTVSERHGQLVLQATLQ